MCEMLVPRVTPADDASRGAFDRGAAAPDARHGDAVGPQLRGEDLRGVDGRVGHVVAVDDQGAQPRGVSRDVAGLPARRQRRGGEEGVVGVHPHPGLPGGLHLRRGGPWPARRAAPRTGPGRRSRRGRPGRPGSAAPGLTVVVKRCELPNVASAFVAVTSLVGGGGHPPVVPFLDHTRRPLAASTTAPVKAVPNRAVLTRDERAEAIRRSALDTAYVERPPAGPRARRGRSPRRPAGRRPGPPVRRPGRRSARRRRGRS